MEDEYRVRYRDKPKKLKLFKKPDLSLLHRIKIMILKEDSCDFVLVINIAHELRIQPYQAGSCLHILFKEGILSSRSRIPYIDKDGDEVFVYMVCPDRINGHVKYVWDGHRWVNRTVSSLTSRVTGRTRHGSTKITDIPHPTWDGTGYYILRDSKQFRNACKEENLPEDPIGYQWICAHCLRLNKKDIDGGVCGACRAAEGPKKDVVEIKKDVVVCDRCNSEIKFKYVNGKKRRRHPRVRCNELLVSNIMNS